MLIVTMRHDWVPPPVHCQPCVLFALFLSVLVDVWTATSLAAVLVSVCRRRIERVLLQRQCVWRLYRCSCCLCGTVVVSLPLCSDFYLLASTDDACLAVSLCFVPSDAFGLSSLCVLYCSSVSSSLFHLPYVFYVPTLCLHANSSPIHPSVSSLLTIFVTRPLHFVCLQDNLLSYGCTL